MVYYLLVQPRRAAAGNFKSNSCVSPRPFLQRPVLTRGRDRRLTEMAIYSVKTNLISAILQICVLVRLSAAHGRSR